MHGDARDPNDMVNASLLTAQQQAAADLADGGKEAEPAASSSGVTGGEVASAIKFVDFDMAGEEGVAVHPMFMNPAVAWPSGATDNQAMLQGHDRELLSQQDSMRAIMPCPDVTVACGLSECMPMARYEQRASHGCLFCM